MISQSTEVFKTDRGLKTEPFKKNPSRFHRDGHKDAILFDTFLFLS